VSEEVVVITEAEIRHWVASQDAVNKHLKEFGWQEALNCLSIAAETNARFGTKTKERNKWRKLSKHLAELSKVVSK
jgi:hypothetical protein